MLRRRVVSAEDEGMARGVRAAEVPLIPVMRELEDRQGRVEPGEHRESDRTVLHRTRTVLRLWSPMW
ncbi:MAG: hypothetical protein QOE72_4296 [Chloroflexota bacterium]|nr:hypothetical protein [Chloroflexota bacterium]